MFRFIFSFFISLQILLFAATSVLAQRALENGSFEENAPALDGSNLYPVSCTASPRVVTSGTWGAYVAAGDIPGWETEASFNATGCGYSGEVIEFSRKNGRDAQDGSHYIELNSSEPAGVTQPICIQTGETVGYSFWHKSSATAGGLPETVEMLVGGMVIDSNTATNGWVEVSGTTTYTGPSGIVDFKFRSTSPAVGSGFSLEGNLLDNVSLTFIPYVQYNTGTWSASETTASPSGPSILVTGEVPSGGLTVPITIVGGTATEGDDFTYTNSISVPAGTYSDTPFAIDFTLLTDAMSESDETIIFGIGNLGTAALVADASCIGTPVVTATFTIQDIPPVVDAMNDTPAAVNGALGATIPNVVANDTLGGVADPAIGTDVTLAVTGTAQDGTTALGLDVTPAAGSISLDPATGEIIVAPGTTAGTYLYTYEICEVLNRANCDTALVTVTVDAATIDAVDDAPAAISGSDGATIPYVLSNDILDGTAGPAIATDVTVFNSGSSQDGTTPIGLDTVPAQGSITFDAASGDVIVAPGTSAGTYTYTYEICEVLNPTNCDNAQVTIRINPAVIDAVDDDFTGSAGSSVVAGSAGPVLTNDTIDGNVVPADGSLTTIALTDDGGMTGATLATDGALTIPAGIAAGTYALTYEICEILNPTNCDSATAQVRITDPDLLALIKEDLTKVLNEDRAAAITQQAARMQGYASDGLQRLKARTATACQQAVNLEAEKILFDTDRAIIKPESSQTLDEIASILGTCKGVAFEIAGHTDSDASLAYNVGLSQRRVNAVLGALTDRGVDTEDFVARAYGETSPATSNATDAGKAQNRRVEFRLIDQAPLVSTCHNGGTLQRRIDGDANDTEAQLDGGLYRETYDCVRDEWTIVESALSFYESDDGQSQRQLNLSFRRERFRDETSLRGWFFGLYGSQNDISSLADGEIAGIGLNGGIYGADQLQNGLYLDYYLGAAAGRHEFDLAFDRSIGTIDADGHYTYFAGFAGIALSGDLDLGEVTVTPRGGLEFAYSPEAEVEVKTSLGNLTQYGDFSLSEISGGRAFIEIRHEWSVWEDLGKFAIAPRVACYEPLVGEALGCTYGGYIEIEQSDDDSPLAYHARLDLEQGETFRTGSFTAGITRRLRRTILRADATVDGDGRATVGSSVEVNF